MERLLLRSVMPTAVWSLGWKRIHHKQGTGKRVLSITVQLRTSEEAPKAQTAGTQQRRHHGEIWGRKIYFYL